MPASEAGVSGRNHDGRGMWSQANRARNIVVLCCTVEKVSPFILHPHYPPRVRVVTVFVNTPLWIVRQAEEIRAGASLVMGMTSSET